MATRLPRTFKNVSTGKVVSTDQHKVTAQDLANQGFNPTAFDKQEQIKGGTLFSGKRDPATGKRLERFVQDKKVTPQIDEGIGGEATAGKTEVTDTSGGTKVETGKITFTSDGKVREANGNIRLATPEELAQSGRPGTSGFGIGAPDREQIRTEKLSDAQSVIDSINQSYSRLLAREEIKGEHAEGRTRALNIAGNLGGSDFATAGAMKTEAKNEKIIKSIEAERDSRVQSILNDVKNDTAETFEARRKEFIEQRDDEIEAEKEFQKQTKTDAMDRVEQLAGTDLDLDTFKQSNKEAYDSLLERTGLSEIELDAIWNAKSETPVKYSYKELKDGTLLRTGDDGSTKEMGNYSPPDDDIAWKVETLEGGALYWTKKDEDGDIIDFKKFDTGKKTGGIPSQSTIDKRTLAEDKKSMTTELSSGVDDEGKPIIGGDGFVAPGNYSIAKKAWTDQGYSPESFDDEFEGFRDPENPNYSIGGSKAETAFQKAEETKRKEALKRTEAEQKKVDVKEKKKEDKIAEEDKTWGTVLSARKNGGQSREKIEKELTKKYKGVPDGAKSWLDRNFK